MLSLHLLWLRRMTAESVARDCVQLAGPVAALAAELDAESMAENSNHGVMTELAFADSMMNCPWLANQ